MVYLYNGILFGPENGLLIYATTLMNPENIILSKRSQIQKTTYSLIPFIWTVPKRQIQRDRKQINLPGLRELDANQHMVSFYVMNMS